MGTSVSLQAKRVFGEARWANADVARHLFCVCVCVCVCVLSLRPAKAWLKRWGLKASSITTADRVAEEKRRVCQSRA